LLLGSLVKRLKKGSMEARVEEAVEAGVGLYNNCWPLSDAFVVENVPSLVLEWCREQMGEMRRPYGLDYVTLALALLGEENEETARFSFGVLRPSDFYEEGSVPQRLAALIDEWRSAGRLDASPWLSAVMFSWGDLTRELLLAG
jgi:hypothetical protein